MIKKFDQFNEELKWSTYRNAQSKLRKLGHKERADKLLKHSYISENRDLGTFNAHIDITTQFSKNYATKKQEWMVYVKNSEVEIKPSKGGVDPGEKMVEKGPLPVYISSISFMDPKESFADDEMTDCDAIDLFVHAIPEDNRVSETFEMFMVSVPLKWISDEEFKLSDKGVSLVEMEHGIVKFSDRKSAMKFKKIFDGKTVNKRISGYDELRNFFMEFSSAEELYRLFDKIKSIPTNELYY